MLDEGMRACVGGGWVLRACIHASLCPVKHHNSTSLSCHSTTSATTSKGPHIFYSWAGLQPPETGTGWGVGGAWEREVR